MGTNQPDVAEIIGEKLRGMEDDQVAQVYRTTGNNRDRNRVVGEEVMRRVLIHADLEPEKYLDRRLQSDDGEVYTDDDGAPIVFKNYLPDGVEQHETRAAQIGATEGVLGFLVSGHKDPTQKKAMIQMIDRRTIEGNT